MAHFSDTDSITSKASLQDLDGGPEHLQILNESKVAIRLAARKHRAAYACFVAIRVTYTSTKIIFLAAKKVYFENAISGL